MPTIIGPEEKVICAGSVTLEGAGCDGAVFQEWTVIDSPVGSSVTFSSPNALTTTATWDIEGTYKFELCCYFEFEP